MTELRPRSVAQPVHRPDGALRSIAPPVAPPDGALPTTASRDAQHLLAMYLRVNAAFAEAQPTTERNTAEVITRLAVQLVPGVEQASVSEGRDGRFRTLAATDDVAAAADKAQYCLREGPCLDVLTDAGSRASANIAEDGRWSEATRAAVAATGVASVLTYRLFADGPPRARTIGLNLYSCRGAAFDDPALIVAQVLAGNSAHALRTAAAHDSATNVESALDSNREIGAAIGILMITHKLTRDDAFAKLRAASQHSNRKLIEVATAVVDTGTLELTGRSRTGRS